MTTEGQRVRRILVTLAAVLVVLTAAVIVVTGMSDGAATAAVGDRTAPAGVAGAGDAAGSGSDDGPAPGADAVVPETQAPTREARPAPKREIRAVVSPGPDRVVGVAAPIIVQFYGHIADRAAAERALSVETSVPVVGSWGWLPDEGPGSRVHWRPREYWPAGTTVTVRADLEGVDYGDGAVGVADIVSTFSIGREQIVTADVTSHRLLVHRDGELVAEYPASYGSGRDAYRTTRSGIHVITEFHEQKRMTSERYDYDVTVDWAVRISNNGEFIHASEDTLPEQGEENVTHGCINLAPGDARAFYDSALYGDPVEVTGSPIALSEADGDIWDWTLGWQEWQGLSAL